ncbi:MAG: hypothetical protein N2235_05930 [Fischerella sp.]|nr:hypothetical protein [Fischerella sp.]
MKIPLGFTLCLMSGVTKLVLSDAPLAKDWELQVTVVKAELV